MTGTNTTNFGKVVNTWPPIKLEEGASDSDVIAALYTFLAAVEREKLPVEYATAALLKSLEKLPSVHTKCMDTHDARCNAKDDDGAVFAGDSKALHAHMQHKVSLVVVMDRLSSSSATAARSSERSAVLTRALARSTNARALAKLLFLRR